MEPGEVCYLRTCNYQHACSKFNKRHIAWERVMRPNTGGGPGFQEVYSQEEGLGSRRTIVWRRALVP